MELPLHSQINIFSGGYLTERLPVSRLFLISSYQSGILLRIKRKLELNIYLDIRFYLNCLPFFYLFWSSHRRCSVEVSVIGGFAGFAGELLSWGQFYNKVAGLWPAALLKGRLWRGCLFLWVLRDFWERPFYRAPLGWLLLSVSSVIPCKFIS